MSRAKVYPAMGVTVLAALLLGIIAAPNIVNADQSATSFGATVSCVSDAQSGCTITHNYGVKPDSVVVTAGGKGQLVSVPADKITSISYRVNFNWHNGSTFAAGAKFTFQVHVDLPSSPSPTPTVSTPPTSATPTTPPTTVSPTPDPTTPPSTPPTQSAWSCVVEKAEGNKGCPDSLSTSGYVYPRLPNSNGYTTYVEKDCWGNPQCQYKLEANNPGDWQVTANEPAGNTGVRTFPDAQQLTNNWCPNDPGFKNCTVASTDMKISQLTKLSSTYAEVTPNDPGIIAQFAWDMWISGNTASSINEIMVWVDNHNRQSGGAPQVGTATIDGQAWTIYRNGTELIWSLGAPGEFAQQTSGTVDLLAVLKATIDKGLLSAGAGVAQVNAGWEICSTGGVDKTFRVTDYSVTAVPA